MMMLECPNLSISGLLFWRLSRVFYGFFHMGCEHFLVRFTAPSGGTGFGCVLFSVGPSRAPSPLPPPGATSRGPLPSSFSPCFPIRSPWKEEDGMRETGLQPGSLPASPGDCVSLQGCSCSRAALSSGTPPALSRVPWRSLLGSSGLGILAPLLPAPRAS